MKKNVFFFSLKKARRWLKNFYLTIRHAITYPDISPDLGNGKTVVFCVNGWVGHGGWTDRLKGIISAYYWAKNNNCQFKLWYSFPSLLENFLSPNIVDWRCNKNDLKFNPFYDKVMNLCDVFDGDGCGSISFVKFRKIFLYYNIDDLQNEELWMKLYFELFEPSEKIIKKVKNLLSPFSKPQIGIVFRFLGLFGDFSKNYSTLSSMLEKEKVASHYLEAMMNFLEKNSLDRSSSVFLFSDSDFFVAKAINTYPNLKTFTQPGRSFIHQEKKDGYKVLERTVIDFYLLANLDHVYLFLDDKVLWRSGFPRYARYLSAGARCDEVKILPYSSQKN